MSMSSSSNSLPYSADQGGYSTHDTLVLLGIGFFATAVSILIIVLCECLCCRRRRLLRRAATGGGATVLLFLGGNGGLSPSAVATLPSFVYHRSDTVAAARGENSGRGGGGWAQCAVCLSMVQEGEAVRRLPACGHLFHVACIDMWLHSHSTCPLCRATVEPLLLGKELPTSKDQLAPPV